MMQIDHPTTEVTTAQLRRWLELLNQPHRLDGPPIEGLLKAHGRLPPSGSPIDIARAMAELLRNKIDKLDPGPHAARPERIPYLVLESCFLRGRKLFQAANELGLSERQMSRERARAIALLRGELLSPLKAPR
jgi:hypothetical protein